MRVGVGPRPGSRGVRDREASDPPAARADRRADARVMASRAASPQGWCAAPAPPAAPAPEHAPRRRASAGHPWRRGYEARAAHRAAQAAHETHGGRCPSRGRGEHAPTARWKTTTPFSTAPTTTFNLGTFPASEGRGHFSRVLTRRCVQVDGWAAALLPSLIRMRATSLFSMTDRGHHVVATYWWWFTVTAEEAAARD